MKKTGLFIVLLMLFQGCVKEVNWALKDTTPPKIIVNALLTDEPKIHSVSLTWSVGELNQIPRPVSGAGVIVSDEDSVWQFKENPPSSGNYTSPPYFFARLNKHYTLIVSYQNQIFSAKATMVPGSVFSELRYSYDDDKKLYYVDWVANGFSTQSAAMWELMIDWSKVPGYLSSDSTTNHARMLFYTLPTLDVSEVFAPRLESVWFPAGTIITERRYSITTDHAAFIRELLLETNWTGGLFNVAAANVNTNLSGGAGGFFGVSAVTALSVTVTP